MQLLGYVCACLHCFFLIFSWPLVFVMPPPNFGVFRLVKASLVAFWWARAGARGRQGLSRGGGDGGRERSTYCIPRLLVVHGEKYSGTQRGVALSRPGRPPIAGSRDARTVAALIRTVDVILTANSLECSICPRRIREASVLLLHWYDILYSNSTCLGHVCWAIQVKSHALKGTNGPRRASDRSVKRDRTTAAYFLVCLYLASDYDIAYHGSLLWVVRTREHAGTRCYIPE